MRASRRPLPVLLTLALTAGLAGCGGEDDSADGERLTRAEYDLMVKQYGEAKALGDGTTDADLRRAVRVSRRHCDELQGSGTVLRATAPACRKAIEASEALVAAAGDECGDDDAACQERSFTRLVDAVDDLTTALERNARAVSRIDAEDACRTVLSGGPDLLSDARAVRESGRRTVAALKAIDSADEGGADAAVDRANAANDQFSSALEAFGRSSGDLEAQDPKACENDVEAS
jgi:hypothetical protein